VLAVTRTLGDDDSKDLRYVLEEQTVTAGGEMDDNTRGFPLAREGLGGGWAVDARRWSCGCHPGCVAHGARGTSP